MMKFYVKKQMLYIQNAESVENINQEQISEKIQKHQVNIHQYAKSVQELTRKESKTREKNKKSNQHQLTQLQCTYSIKKMLKWKKMTRLKQRLIEFFTSYD